MTEPFDALLSPTRPVTVVLSHDIDAAWAQVQGWGDDLDSRSRMVACRWDAVPEIGRLIDDAVRAFARVALSDWPHWYGTDLSTIAKPVGNEFERNQELRNSLGAISRQRLRVVKPWLRRSAQHCLRGELPFNPCDNVELQAGQLSLAVCPDRLIVVLVAGPKAPDGGAVALAAAGEWLHRVTGASAVIVAPVAWRGAPGLDRLWVAPRTLELAASVMPLGDGSVQSGPGGEPANQHNGGVPAVTPVTAPGPAIAVTPLAGRPHPNSDAERLLFDRVQADPVLASLLAFNQPVGVDLDQSYRVDIVSPARKVVVEVDGPDHRGVAYKYIADCERDYRLMKHGYVVLRLPNELVLCNIDVAVARIRDILRCREGVERGGR